MAPTPASTAPVVDTETHVFVRSWPIETSPYASRLDPFTRTEHDGALLVAELDRAGVDAAILIGYDGYDFVSFMRRFRSLPGDFMGGRGYTRAWAARFPGRLHYVTTLHDWRAHDALALLVEELDLGAVGVKVFPAYLRCLPDANEIRAVFDVLHERSCAAAFGFEDTVPPDTPSLREMYEGIARLAGDYPDVPIQLNHGANADPFGPEVELLFDVVRAHPNVLVSTSVLGGVLMEWADGWRYPFPEYLRRLAVYAEGVPSRQLAWGTDWPWFEGTLKYPQLLGAIVEHAGFLTDEAKRLYLGENALHHWRLEPGS
jgi:predicted TIM-barrel fold metal-dependent hydrolase